FPSECESPITKHSDLPAGIRTLALVRDSWSVPTSGDVLMSRPVEPGLKHCRSTVVPAGTVLATSPIFTEEGCALLRFISPTGTSFILSTRMFGPLEGGRKRPNGFPL